MKVLFHHNVEEQVATISATLRYSLYLSSLLGIEILMEKYPSTDFLGGYLNVTILHSAFLANQK
jgi:hypothetical protein